MPPPPTTRAGIAHAHRRDHVRGLVDEQVGEHAAAEVPVAAPLGEDGPVERHAAGPSGTPGTTEKLMAEEHVPVDGRRVHVLGQRVVAPLADERVAVVAGLGLGDVADLAAADHLVGLAPGRVGHRLHADGHDDVVLRRAASTTAWASSMVLVIGFSQ